MAELKVEITENSEVKNCIKNNEFNTPKPGAANDKGGFRLKFERQYPDGKKGPIVLKTPPCFSYGVSENVNDGALTGYSMCLVLHDSNSCTPEQREFIDCWSDIYKWACSQVLKHRVAINKSHLNKQNITGSLKDPVYKVFLPTEGDEDPIIDSSKAPKLYVKLNTGWEPVEDQEEVKTVTKSFKQKVKQNGKQVEVDVEKKMVVNTEMWTADGDYIDPLEMKNRNCTVTGCVVIDGIYIGGTSMSFQLKLTEAEIRTHQAHTGTKLLQRPTKVAGKTGGKPKQVNIVIEDEDEVSTPPKKKPAPVKKDETVKKPSPVKEKEQEPEQEVEEEQEPEQEPEQEVEQEQEPEQEVEEEQEPEPEPPAPKKTITTTKKLKVNRKKPEPEESADDLLDE